MAEYHLPPIEEYERQRLAFENGQITIDQFRERMGLPRIDRTRLEPNGMVDKWYEMDPEVEELIYDGTELVEGMVILIESPEMRVDVREVLTDEQLFRARRTNRWMMISRIMLSPDRTHVTFLAEFEDGVKSKLDFEVRESWLCKFGRPVVGIAQVPGQESIPVEDPLLVPPRPEQLMLPKRPPLGTLQKDATEPGPREARGYNNAIGPIFDEVDRDFYTDEQGRRV